MASHSEEGIEEPFQLYRLAEEAEDEADSGFAIECLQRGLEVLVEKLRGAPIGAVCQISGMPLPLLRSQMHNALGARFVEGSREALDQYEKAAFAWRGNGIAFFNAGEHHRECGRIPAAISNYKRCIAIKESLGEKEEDHVYYDGWWGCQLLEATNDAARRSLYLLSMCLHLTGSPRDFLNAVGPLQQMGAKHRISPVVWRLAKNRQNIGGDAACSSSRKEVVQMWLNAIPRCDESDADGATGIFSILRSAFRPGAAFWRETSYAERGYYSFWFDIGNRGPSNAVEELIAWYLFPLVKDRLGHGRAGYDSTELVGCEWWCHSREMGKSSVGHQLHYDTDEIALAERGAVLHPLLSSVVYLTGNADGFQSAPTIVLDQALGPDGYTTFAKRGWLCHPSDRAFMVFPGDRLHGVMPDIGQRVAAGVRSGKRGTAVGAPLHRLTLMVGWWTREPGHGGRGRRSFRLGPCAPVPPSTRSSHWVSELPLSGSPEPSPSSPRRHFVPEISPVWEVLPGGDDTMEQSGVKRRRCAGVGHNDGSGSEEIEDDAKGDSIPEDLNGHFFVQSASDFCAASLRAR